MQAWKGMYTQNHFYFFENIVLYQNNIGYKHYDLWNLSALTGFWINLHCCDGDNVLWVVWCWLVGLHEEGDCIHKSLVPHVVEQFIYFELVISV
jgi:hypothetical protein